MQICTDIMICLEVPAPAFARARSMHLGRHHFVLHDRGDCPGALTWPGRERGREPPGNHDVDAGLHPRLPAFEPQDVDGGSAPAMTIATIRSANVTAHLDRSSRCCRRCDDRPRSSRRTWCCGHRHRLVGEIHPHDCLAHRQQTDLGHLLRDHRGVAFAVRASRRCLIPGRRRVYCRAASGRSRLAISRACSFIRRR